MKKFSAPPMIIILDVLFVVLFFLVLEESPNIKIILPTKVWLNDSVVIGVNKDNKMVSFFDDSSKEWRDISLFKPSDRKFDFLIGNIDCNSNSFCKQVPLPALNIVKKIYIQNNLYDQISGLISDSCLTFPKECTTVNYFVTDEGVVDTQRLQKEYPIFQNILKDE